MADTRSFAISIGSALLAMLVAGTPPAPAQDLNQRFQEYMSHFEARRFDEAERVARQTLAEVTAQGNSIAIGNWATNLGNLAFMRGRYATAEQFHRQALAVREAANGPQDRFVAMSLDALAGALNAQGRYAEAEPLLRRSLAIQEALLGPMDPALAITIGNLATVASNRGDLDEAESLQRRSIQIIERSLGPEHIDLAVKLNNLAAIFSKQGRIRESEATNRRALAIREKALGPDHPDVAMSLMNLASSLKVRGQYAQAEPLFRRALEVWEKTLGPEHADLAYPLNNLADLYRSEERSADAERLFRRALAIREKALGPDHRDVAWSLNTVASMLLNERRHAEAEPLLRRAAAIQEKALRPDHPELATTLSNLGSVAMAMHRNPEAESLFRRALAIREKALGAAHSETALGLYDLGEFYASLGRDAEAAPLVERAISAAERAGESPARIARYTELRARLEWRAGHRDEAVKWLKRAMDLAELQRGTGSGSAQDRAALFGRFSDIFETMVRWQAELGDVAEALAAVERIKARSLVELMTRAGADPLAGVPGKVADALRRREAEARSRVSEWTRRQAEFERQAGDSTAERSRQSEVIQAGLRVAQQQYLDAYRAIRNAAPAYRLGGGEDHRPRSLEAIQGRLNPGGLLLEYVVGVEEGYLLVIPPAGQRPRITRLAVTDDQARVLGVDRGPLTTRRLRTILSRSDGRGLLQLLARPGRGSASSASLAALWEILVPEAERIAIRDGSIRRLSIVPDGPLASLPFEALVVEPGPEPKYLLDAGPPILYAPSATVLYNLGERAGARPVDDREPVLAVGDPAYGEAGAADPTPATSAALAALAPRARYTAVGGRPTRLPHSAWEVQWVSRNYGEAGVRVGTLSRATATERGVRYWSPGRRVLHLACHGLTDDEHGNLFGALALTPGPNSGDDPADDGLLTLAEIYELDLRGTELTILSACQTNYGPQQGGEGTWALSRGFLVAGSRRVVASNWRVDDEATASLVSVFCGALARAEKAGKPLDHAESLQQAKRWVRQQEKWKAPYYWASMVLVGPP